jgi:NAD+ kinase
MRILILGNAHRPGVQAEAERLLPLLQDRCEIVGFDLQQQQDLGHCTADLALVLGGDGAILRAARQMGYCQIPVLGVNLGKLGFLADLSPDEFRAAVPLVLAREYRVTRHVMFECLVDAPEGQRTLLGLNEVTIQTGPPFHMVDFDLFVDGQIVSRFGGDGLIISTPVGSTAHNLSAGGPILEQELPAFAITPVCPHSLSNRPVVDSADKVYTVVVRRSTGGTVVVVDGQEILPVAAGQEVVVRRAPVHFQLVRVPGRSYYQTLRDKLRWGTTPNYRSEP